ncbi:MAG TPA: Rne/Rng family ribonuclease [Candidatus Tectomicrobia bacterium]|nr:Rne/Rng family ribonuclease [Candidatus Tectomicrobia bacterium]
MIRKMLINAEDAEESRVAIVADGILEEFDIETCHKEQNKSNIYKGVVVKVEAGLQAAFVDYGGKRAGFLPLGEVHPTCYADPELAKRGRVRIHDVLKRNQELLIQIVKDEIGTKGAALSTYISLPGRYLVLMPGVDATRVSRKIEDEAQRRQLKEIVAQLAPPPGTGVIIRTAGLDRTKQELQRDMAYLLKLWETILLQAKELPAPSVVYEESDLVIRSIRDYFTPDIAEILVDDREVFKRAREFLQAIMPRYVNRIKLYREKRPIFSKYQLEDQIEAIFEDKIPLKSGGSIVIERTEAMVSIDVNSGRSTQERGMEETAFKTNMEAAEEIARQLRLRDLGGLVVIDFIDMRDRKHIQEVERCLKNALKRDKARTEMSRISKFGLLEVSRQRLKPALQDETSLPCPHCKGQGLIRSKESLGLTVLRKIQAAAVKGYLLSAKAKVPLEVANYLLNEKRDRLLKIEQEYGIRIHVEGDAALTGSLFNLALEKKDITALEEEAPETEVEAQEEVEVAAGGPLGEEVTLAEVATAGEAAAAEAFEEAIPSPAEVGMSLVEATLSVEGNGASTATETTTASNGSPLPHTVSSPARPPSRRPLRFWWLRRLVASPSRSMGTPLGHGAAADVTADPEALSAASATSAPSAHGHRSGETSNRLPDAEAPWRRMLPPIRPPLQLPRRGVDDAPTGDYL